MNYFCFFETGRGAVEKDSEQLQNGNPWDKAGKTCIINIELISGKII